MAYPVTLNGRTYTLADFEGQNYVDGLPDAFEDFVTHAGNLYSTTSTTSNSIGTGSKTFTVESSKPYQVGTPLRITDSAAPSTNWIDAIVTAYSGTTLTVDAVSYAGSGTKTSWNINIGGGGTSYTGTLPIAQGGTGATTAAAARTNLDTYSKSEADSRFLNVSGEASDVTITGDLDVQGNSGMGGGSGTPVTMRISDLDNGGSWPIGEVSAALDFYLNDVSGVGQGTRGRIGIATQNASAGSSSLDFQVAPSTAGTMQTAMRILSTKDTVIRQAATIGADSLGGSNTTLHVEGTDGASGANVNILANEVFIDNDGDAGMTIGSSATGTGGYAFADPDVSLRAGMFYSHSADALYFRSTSADGPYIHNTHMIFGDDQEQAFSLTPKIQILGTDASSSAFQVARFQNGAFSSYVQLAKSRATSVTGTNDNLQDDDTIGTIRALGDDGTDINTVAAQIDFGVDGETSQNDMPGRITMATTIDGDSAPTERIRVNNRGEIILQPQTSGYGNTVLNPGASGKFSYGMVSGSSTQSFVTFNLSSAYVSETVIEFTIMQRRNASGGHNQIDTGKFIIFVSNRNDDNSTWATELLTLGSTYDSATISSVYANKTVTVTFTSNHTLTTAPFITNVSSNRSLYG